MSVVCDEKYKNTVGARICIRLAHAIKSREIRDEELPEVCNFVLVAIKTIDSLNGMVDFLSTLAARWPVFSGIYIGEKKTLENASEG